MIARCLEGEIDEFDARDRSSRWLAWLPAVVAALALAGCWWTDVDDATREQVEHGAVAFWLGFEIYAHTRLKLRGRALIRTCRHALSGAETTKHPSSRRVELRCRAGLAGRGVLAGLDANEQAELAVLDRAARRRDPDVWSWSADPDREGA